MTQAADPIAFSRFSGYGSGDPDHDPAAFAAQSGYDSSYWETLENVNAPAANAESSRFEGGTRIVDLPGNNIPAGPPASSSQPEPPPVDVPAYREPAPLAYPPDPDVSVVIVEATEAPSAAPLPPAPPPGPDYNIILVPSDIRPPENRIEPDSSYFIAGISPQPQQQAPADIIDPSLFIDPIPETARDIDASRFIDSIPETTRETRAWEIDPSLFIDPIPETPQIARPNVQQPNVQPDIQPNVQPDIRNVKPWPEPFFPDPYRNPDTPVFSAPLISRLERGRYYLQIAAFSSEEMVSSELSKIDHSLPVAVMSAGSTRDPVYRILIGPVNLGESGALLQRFRGSYKDAFVRIGS
jgi:hypothetical protein